MRAVAFVTAGVLAAVVCVVAVGGWGVYHFYNRQVHRVPLKVAGVRPPAPPRGVVNALLVGSDSRAGTTAYGQVSGQRSDTIMLAHLAADGSVTVLSFPRDMYVTIPAWTDAAGHAHAAGQNRINAALSYGGPSLLVQTIESLTKIRIERYLSVDLAGFQSMTDAIGGVDVCLAQLPANLRAAGEDNTHDKTGWSGHVGINYLNGKQALAFVRTRYSLPRGDLDRIRRQQVFLAGVVKKATSTGVLTDPLKLGRLIDAFSKSLTVDSGATPTELRTIAERLQGVDSSDVVYETVPVRTPGPADGAEYKQGLWEINGMAVEIYDQDQLDYLTEPLRGGTSNTHAESPFRLAAATTSTVPDPPQGCAY